MAQIDIFISHNIDKNEVVLYLLRIVGKKSWNLFMISKAKLSHNFLIKLLETMH